MFDKRLIKFVPKYKLFHELPMSAFAAPLAVIARK